MGWFSKDRSPETDRHDKSPVNSLIVNEKETDAHLYITIVILVILCVIVLAFGIRVCMQWATKRVVRGVSRAQSLDLLEVNKV